VAQKENYTVHKCREEHLLYFDIICISQSPQPLSNLKVTVSRDGLGF
jgi:hypothetical protein